MRLAIRNVARAFGATRALSRVDLEAGAGAGEIHAVLGENGAGKSTLMKILAGADAPDSGDVVLDGVAYRPRGPAEARRLGVSLVSQELSLCPHLTVSENIVLGDEPTRFGPLGVLDRPRIARDVDAVLRDVAGSRIRPDARAGDLPLAEQQLVEIARALVPSRPRCKVLILDEPTSSLGQEDTARLFALVRRLRDEGVTILYISHFLEEVKALCDRYTVLRDGVTVAAGAIAETTSDALVEKMAGRQIEEVFGRGTRDRTKAGDAEVLLALDGLGGSPKPLRASLTLRRGEILGIAGLVGAGRSEMLRAIFGLDPVTRGTVRVKQWQGPASPRTRLAQGLGLLSEDRQGEGLATSLTIADNITLSSMPSFLVSPRAQRDASARFVRDLAIKCTGPEQRVVDLSGGNQQKVALARLLHHDVDVLLLDEPTRGIDVGSKAQIYALIETLAAAGKGVVMVSSYLPELLGVCDRIAVMARGVLGDARPTAAWTEHTLLEAALAAHGTPEGLAS